MKTNSNGSVIAAVIAALAVLLAARTFTGCAGSRLPQPPITLIAALDESGSNESLLEDGKRLLARADAILDPHDRIAIWRIGPDTKPVRDQTPHRGFEDALRFLHRQFPAPSEKVRTLPEKFWTGVATAAAERNAPPTVALAVWDGENSDMTARSASAIRTAAQSLAGNPKVLGVLVVGVKPASAETFLEQFAPLRAAGKLHWWPDTDPQPRQVLERIAHLRRNRTAAAAQSDAAAPNDNADAAVPSAPAAADPARDEEEKSNR